MRVVSLGCESLWHACVRACVRALTEHPDDPHRIGDRQPRLRREKKQQAASSRWAVQEAHRFKCSI
eukprot:3502767-Pleurochrysis_carterae.AAC.5